MRADPINAVESTMDRWAFGIVWAFVVVVTVNLAMAWLATSGDLHIDPTYTTEAR
jgi:nitrogen fixation protein FixH